MPYLCVCLFVPPSNIVRARERKLERGSQLKIKKGAYFSALLGDIVHTYVNCTNLDIKLILKFILGLVIIFNSFNTSPDIRLAEYFDKFL